MRSFTKLIIVIICFLVIPFISFSQTNHHNDNHSSQDLEAHIAEKLKKTQLLFDEDSIKGFREEAAWQQARMHGAPLWEQKIQVSGMKRLYINTKYGINNARSGGGTPTVQAPCTNVNFETGDASGWTLTEGVNSNSQTMGGCCLTSPTSRYSVETFGTDADVPVLQMVPPGAGNYTLKLGDGGTVGGYAARARQTFSVTPANSVFIYRFAVVLEDGSHTCTEQPYFNIAFTDASNNPIPCSDFNVVQVGSACSGGDPSFVTYGIYSYKDWTTRSFDLTPYMGQNVTVQFTASDCVPTGHAGWGYVDASCQPMTLNLNGIDIPVGQHNSSFCAIGNNTLCAPAGFTSYTWTGPGVTGQTGQCVSANTIGSYSVTLGMAGTSCASPVLYSDFILVPKPIADFNFTTTPCQSTFTVPFADNSNLNGGPALTYFWDFDNNGTVDDAIANPNYDFTTSGTYTTKLKISNGGCLDSITKVVTVTAAPTANFNTSSACLNVVTNFTSTATPTIGIISHTWDFGEAPSAGTGPNPTHTYTSPGTKVVTYTVANASCSSVITKTLVISPNPVTAFSANTVCLGAPTVFGNTSNVATPDNINGWDWDFDNNGTVDNSGTQLPTNTYTAAGNYNVELRVTTNNGCKDSLVIPVNVGAIPTASFTAANACTNSNVLLNNTSSVPLPAALDTYTWTFAGGNPGSSNAQNPPLLAYGSSGQKTITLNITANNSCTATITQTVDIYPQPVANFSTTSVCQSTITTFTDLSTTSVGTVTGWAWDFTNNGSIDPPTSNAPTNLYPSSGTFTALLIATSSNGCKDTIALPVNVWGHTIPNFTPDKVCFGTSTAFTNLTDDTTNPNVGTGTTYLWNFGDNTGTSNANAPSHIYTVGGNANGTYNVTLASTSAHGCVDSIVKQVNVYALPTASFTSNNVCLGVATTLTDASNGNGNTVNAYTWDFENNSTIDISGVSNPNYTFPNYGNNSVSYTVSTSPVTGLICSNSTNTIQVWVNPIPVPDFTFVNKCINAQPNTFDGAPSTIAIGTNTNYAWAYGDTHTSPSNALSPSTHIYGAAGVYNTTLTVTSDKGCQKTMVKQVEVYEKPHMIIANSPACDQKAMTFTAVAQPNSGVVTSWYWDLNNSISTIEATGQTIGYTFTGPGAHTVTLVSETSIGGCRDTLIKQIYVNYVPVANFIGDTLKGCPHPKFCVNFTDLSPVITGPAQLSQWIWTFGDGTTATNSTNASMGHCYTNRSSSQVATFDVSLQVVSDSGCVSAVNNKPAYITVYPTPIAAYTVNPNPGNVLTPLEYFTNQSIDYTKWWWSFGDGPYKSDSVNVDPVHFYSDETATTYYTNLIVINQYGCKDTAYVAVEIGPEFTFYIPNAFSPGNDDGINDYFTGKGIGIEHYEMWIFDRWGERIFYTDDIAKGWDGRVQGKSAEGKQDVYTWKVKLRDVLGKKHEYIGHVTLLR